MASAEPLLTPRTWLILVVQSLFGLGWSAYLLLPKYLAVAMHADPATIGQVSSVNGFAAVATIPLVTALIDRVGRLPLFRAGLALLALSSAGFVFVDRVGPLIYVLQLGVGASFVLAFNASVTMFTDQSRPERLGQMIGLLGASNMITNAVAAAGTEQIAAHSGWPSVFGFSAACAGLGLVATLGMRESTASAPAPKSGALTLALRGPLTRILGVSVLMGAAFIALFTFHQPYALELGRETVAAFFIGFTTTAVIMRVFFGSLGDRYGRRPVSVAALVLYGLVIAATAGLKADWLWVYGAGFGLAHGVAYPTLTALAVELAPPEVRGRVITLFNGGFNAGAAFSAIVWGALASRYGYASVFLPAGALGLLSAAVLALHKRP